MLSEVGMVAADTPRTRAYLSALERHNLLPSVFLLLEDGVGELIRGKYDNSAKGKTVPELDLADNDWSEVSFSLTEPLISLLKRLKIDIQIAGSRDINSTSVIEAISNSEPSVFIYSGYGGVLLKSPLLSCGKRFLHVHGGCLPKFKGSTTSYYQLLEEDTMGAAAIFLTEKIDEGPILLAKNFPAPSNRELIDYIYDPAARARVLVETLHAFQTSGQWLSEPQADSHFGPFYIIHPVLKHVAILAEDPSCQSK